MRSSTGSVRTSSQISIYDYPDHLNPFAEDDNHKRLRFWKLSKHNDNRRRSFSMENLRGIWNFKSFSLKKKSSTLGIQKTSESPPVMRRHLDSNSLHPGDQTFGRRPYVNSMQDIDTPRGTSLNFVRSPQRSTISEGYLTPQSQRFHPRRSSQTSLASTNPFESDIDSDATDIGSVSLGGGRKSYRKKRRAPLAPTKEMVSKKSPSPVRETSIDRQSSATVVEQSKAIRSLAVEIEQFVNNSSETTTLKIPTVVVEPSSAPQSPQAESKITEETYLSKLPSPSLDASRDAIKEETKTTVNCTSTCDPVTETVQLDKFNSNIGEIVVSSIVIDQPQAEPNISKEKCIPKPPIRTNASRTERVKENKITDVEHTSTKDQILENVKVDEVIKIVETTSVADCPQEKEKFSFKKCSPKPPIRSNSLKPENVKESKITNIEYTLKSDQVSENAQLDKLNGNLVKIVETSTVHEFPQGEGTNSGQNSGHSVKTESAKEIKIPNTEYTSRYECHVVNTLESPSVSEGPQNEHKISDQICLSQAPAPSQNAGRESAKEIKIPNLDYTSASAQSVTEDLPVGRFASRSQNNFTNIQTYSIKGNHNAENYEYLNKPLAIFENPERKLDHSEDGAQPAKAKSVKEIIDSINRSQKLLKDSAAKGTTVYSTSLYAENNVRPISHQGSSQIPEISPNILTGSSCAENNLQSEQTYFKKSKINKTAFQYRESSPTALNLDWNPLPKPKRINNGSTM